MKVFGVFVYLLLFGLFSEAQVSLVVVNGQGIYVTQGSILCSYSGSSGINSGMRFNFDKGRPSGYDKALVSYVINGIEQNPSYVATVKTDLVSSDIVDYRITGEAVGVKYSLIMNRSTKVGTGKYYKGQGTSGFDMNCKYAK